MWSVGSGPVGRTFCYRVWVLPCSVRPSGCRTVATLTIVGSRGMVLVHLFPTVDRGSRSVWDFLAAMRAPPLSRP